MVCPYTGATTSEARCFPAAAQLGTVRRSAEAINSSRRSLTVEVDVPAAGPGVRRRPLLPVLGRLARRGHLRPAGRAVRGRAVEGARVLIEREPGRVAAAAARAPLPPVRDPGLHALVLVKVGDRTVRPRRVLSSLRSNNQSLGKPDLSPRLQNK